MSRVHIHLVRESKPGPVIHYRVDSSDFSASQTPEPIARVAIDPVKGTYTFEPLGELSEYPIVPPFVYDLPATERDHLLATRYANSGYGGWTSRIAHVVRTMLRENEFPEEARGIT
jgi:hypothetical protein